KTYQALTAPASRKLETEWTIRNYSGKPSSKSKRARYAETSFRLIDAHQRGLWIEAIPRTGRTHQIRVHLSEYGVPILGDDLYGPKESDLSVPRLMLHASRLIFPHPITKREVVIASPLPGDFQACLKSLDLITQSRK